MIPKTVEGVGYVDEIALLCDPTKHGRQMVVLRTYRAISERLGLEHEEPWVRWRKALQGCDS